MALSLRQQVAAGIAALRGEGVVAFPTDTVYGLGAIGTQRAVTRIYEVKGRPRDLALPLLLADGSQMADVAREVPMVARRLAERFWPGALTLVLLKSGAVPDFVTGGGPSVAVRVPDHPVPVALVRGVGQPIVGTSANRSGQPSTLTAGEVYAQLGDRVDLVIDGGPCPLGRDSTIVDLSGGRPVVLRRGAIPVAALQEVSPDIILKGG